MNFTFTRLALLLFLCISLISSCTKTDSKKEEKATDLDNTIDNREPLNFTFSDIHSSSRERSDLKTANPSGSDLQLMKVGPCGTSFSGNHLGSGFYRYPQDTIDASAIVEGGTINVFVDATSAGPNRFTVYDGVNGSMVAASPWMGTASYPGPWGGTLNTYPSGTLSFQRSPTRYYYLVTETSLNGQNDFFQASVSCTSPTGIVKAFGSVNITYYSASKLLRFNAESDLAYVLDKLEADYETYNTNYENQYPNYDANQLDIQDSILNFNEWQTVDNFEALFSGRVSKRKDLLTLENNWLNTAIDLTDATDPDSLNYAEDYFHNALLNQEYKLIVGTSTFQYKLDGLYKNGIKYEEDEGTGSTAISASGAVMAAAAPVFCTYCDTCKNWQRKSNWTIQFTDTDGRKWKYKKVIAIRGISPDGRGYVRATIKGRRKSGSKWKRKRAYLMLQSNGSIWSSQCTQERTFNSGVYYSNRPRIWKKVQYAAAGVRFFRTKKDKVIGIYGLRPKNSDTWYQDNLKLSW